MDLQLKDRKALITGSSKGLGFATAKVLLEEGAYVMINSRSKENVDAAIKILRPSAEKDQLFGMPSDVTKEEDVMRLIKETNNILDGLDILITNSGGPPAGNFEDFSSEDWQNAINLSFTSHLNLIRHALPLLKKSKFPSVLAITSFTIKNPLDSLVLSNSIRAATAALIKSLSFEFGKNGIRFNSILPGWTYTNRVKNLIDIKAKSAGKTSEEIANGISSSIPLGRIGLPEEFARTAAFLVSPAASYINGVLLTVDGGITKSLL